MRRPVEYPPPKYHDPKDRRLTQIVRQATDSRPNAVNLVGVPFDGAVLGRRGAVDGPDAIREAMSGFSNFNPELRVGIENARIFDLGDIVTDKDDVTTAHRQIEPEILRLLRPDSLLVILGGDNSVSLPSLRSCARKFGKLGLIVVDSHLDLRGEIDGKPSSGSSYGLALGSLDELDGNRVVELGVHGFLNSEKYFAKAKELGITLVTAADVARSGAERVAREAYAVASKGAKAVYLSVDLDAVSISEVSGVSAPSVGGLASKDVCDIVYTIAAKRKVRCADIVELAPSLDPTGRSSRVAATVFTHMAAGFHSRN